MSRNVDGRPSTGGEGRPDWDQWGFEDFMREGERSELRWSPRKRAALVRGCRSPSVDTPYLFPTTEVESRLDGGGWDGPGEGHSGERSEHQWH